MNRTLTVKELIEQLKRFDEKLPVRTEDLCPIDHAYLSEIKDEEGNIRENLVILGEIPF